MGFLQTWHKYFPMVPDQAEENLYLFSMRCRCRSDAFPEYGEIKECLLTVSTRDTVKAKISFEGEYELDLTNCNKKSYDEYIQEYGDEKLNIKIEIEKRIADDCISVYSFPLLTAFLEKLSVPHCMRVFSGFMKKQREPLYFEILDGGEITFQTKSFLFAPPKRKTDLTSFHREERLTRCQNVSSFQNSEISVLLPDDFHVVSQVAADVSTQGVRKNFEKICTVLSIAYLANIAVINESLLQFKFVGNTLLEQSEKLDEIKENDTLYKIYDWVYKEVHAEDKLLIARNAILFHGAAGQRVARVEDDVLQSIYVEFSLYLKKNAEQFIDAKNKLGQFICDLVSKLDQYTIGFLDKFKANLMAIGIFLFTTAIVNIASEQPLNNILTPDIMGILTIFFIASIIYMVVCNYEVNQQMTMTKNAYDDLKENYKEVLTADEIEQIFSNENGVVQRVNEAKKKKRWYLFVWGLILTVLFLVLLALSGGVNFTRIVPFESLQQATSETAAIKMLGSKVGFLKELGY